MEKNIPGWMTSNELTWIADLVKGRGDVLEIGTYCGLTTRTLLRHTKGLVFSVDPLDRAEPVHNEARQWIKDLAKEYSDRLVFIPALSDELIWTRPVDVLFLDGSHERDQVYRDLKNLVPCLTSGGLLILDDWTSIQNAWKDFRDEFKITAGNFSPLGNTGKAAAFLNGR
jgi:predicted O-methyltransferase YrrM